MPHDFQQDWLKRFARPLHVFGLGVLTIDTVADVQALRVDDLQVEWAREADRTINIRGSVRDSK